VNLRSGPGTTFAVIRPLAAKTEVDLVGMIGEGDEQWFKIRAGDDEGWVSGTVVAVDAAVAATLPVEESFAAASAPTEPPAAPTVAPAAAPSATTAIVIVKEPGTVSAGRRASVTIRTAPRAMCSITVWYKSGPSTAAGLDNAQTDAKGLMSWAWKVGTRTTSGTWPITITCGDQPAETEVTVP
jgi:micrococcal nuclease